MMNLEQRTQIMIRLGKYLLEKDQHGLEEAIHKAFTQNKWFTDFYCHMAINNIATYYLAEEKLREWIQHYRIDDNIEPRKVGVVMAGNIPLVGFHDFLCGFISGHHLVVKLSEKDNVLFKHIVDVLISWNPDVSEYISIADSLKDCDAYIATGSNNSSRYFEYYFGKYPSIIRKNKTSVALLTGAETENELNKLAEDVSYYFGLGCRSVTKIFVPKEYDFEPLLKAFNPFFYYADHSKFRNNYDYNLSLLIMNNRFYMTNDAIIFSENESVFSPVSVLHYSFYENLDMVKQSLDENNDLQCIVGAGYTGFGAAQQPSLMDYADGVDTMQFLLSL